MVTAIEKSNGKIEPLTMPMMIDNIATTNLMDSGAASIIPYESLKMQVGDPSNQSCWLTEVSQPQLRRLTTCEPGKIIGRIRESILSSGLDKAEAEFIVVEERLKSKSGRGLFAKIGLSIT